MSEKEQNSAPGENTRFIGEKPLMAHASAGGAMEVPEQSRSVIPWLVATAFFMQMLDGTILNTALPSIARSLDASPLRMQSVVIAYLLTVAMLIPATGWVADRFGIRRTFISAIVVFTLGSLFCAMAQTLVQLVIGRIIQGIGGAFMTPVGRLAILRITPRKDLIRVMSFIAIPGLVGPLLGPTLGGLLVEYASWHWIFLINIPVGIAGCWLSWRYMPPLRLPEVFKFDWAGFLLLAAGMVTFSMALEGMGELHMNAAVYNSLFAAALMSLLIYIIYARKAAHPLFDLGIFKNRAFSIGIAGNLLARLGGGAMPFLMPLFWQIGMGFSPAKAGMTMIPVPLGAMTSKMLVAKMVNRLGYRKMLRYNTVLIGLLLMSFSHMWKYDNYFLMLAHLFLFGVINSTQFSIMNTSTLMNLGAEEASTGNSIFSVVLQLSQSISVSIAAFVLTFFISQTGGAKAASGTGMLQAFSYTYIAMGCITISSSLIFIFMPKTLDRDTKKKLPGPQY